MLILTQRPIHLIHVVVHAQIVPHKRDQRSLIVRRAHELYPILSPPHPHHIAEYHPAKPAVAILAPSERLPAAQSASQVVWRRKRNQHIPHLPNSAYRVEGIIPAPAEPRRQCARMANSCIAAALGTHSTLAQISLCLEIADVKIPVVCAKASSATIIPNARFRTNRQTNLPLVGIRRRRAGNTDLRHKSRRHVRRPSHYRSILRCRPCHSAMGGHRRGTDSKRTPSADGQAIRHRRSEAHISLRSRHLHHSRRLCRNLRQHHRSDSRQRPCRDSAPP